MLKLLKYLFSGLLLVFIAISIYWQCYTEYVIKEVRRNCSYVEQKKRVKYTLIVMYYGAYLAGGKRELKQNRILYLQIANSCNNIVANGCYLEYMMHVYFTPQEKDSLLKMYNLDIDHPYHFQRKLTAG